MKQEITRCTWAETSLVEQEYHDTIWGRPEHDDRKLFKMLVLESKQAGLSWSTILKKMDTLCLAFDDFDPHKLILYDDVKKAELMKNPGIIRHKLKVDSVVTNAKAYFEVVEKHGSLNNFLWAYVDNKPLVGKWERLEQIPTSTPLAHTMSKDLKKLGFSFLGPTTVYAFMQAVGMVNDHLVSCAFYKV